MKGGVIILVVGLFVGYMAITGKYACFSKALDCLLSEDDDFCGCGSGAASGDTSKTSQQGFPVVTPLVPLQPLKGVFG